MSYHVYFNNDEYSKDLSSLDIIPREDIILLDELDIGLCRGTFTNELIMQAVGESSFVLYYENDGVITGIACMTIYGPMWEISYICVSAREKGLGSRLIEKLKEIASLYDPKPITLYGLAIYPASEKLYLKNGFVDKKFEVAEGKKRRSKRFKKSKKSKKSKRSKRSKRSKKPTIFVYIIY